MDDSPKFKTGLSPSPANANLLDFLVRRLPAAGVAKFLRFQPLAVLLLVFRRRVVAVLALTALQRNRLAHRFSALMN